MISAELPRIVKFHGTEDGGDGAVCPHCGATGRWIIRFQVEDGRQLGAMRGCVKLFPVTELAQQQEYFAAKRSKYAANRPPWNLSRADQQALQLLEDAIAGNGDPRLAISMAQTVRTISKAKARRRR